MKRAFTLISSLITIALILLLAVVFLKGGLGDRQSLRKDKKDQTVVGAVILASKDTVCRSNLSQARQMVLALQSMDGEDTLPGSLEEAKVPAEMRICPVGKVAYVYDPQAYAENKDLRKLVRCPHLGHEKY